VIGIVINVIDLYAVSRYPVTVTRNVRVCSVTFRHFLIPPFPTARSAATGAEAPPTVSRPGNPFYGVIILAAIYRRCSPLRVLFKSPRCGSRGMYVYIHRKYRSANLVRYESNRNRATSDNSRDPPLSPIHTHKRRPDTYIGRLRYEKKIR